MDTTTTIRVTVDDRDRLNELAAERGVSASRVIGQLIEDDLKRKILDDWDDFRERDPSGYQEELRQAKAWDVTLADGLTDEGEKDAA